MTWCREKNSFFFKNEKKNILILFFSWLDTMSATSKEMEAVIIDVSVHILQVLRKVTINIEEKL